MRPLSVYLCDLTHDTVIVVSDVIPINVGFLGAYAKKVHGDEIQVSLFKYPKTAIQAIRESPPDVLALSNYSWNSLLSERMAGLAKEINPRVITVQGGTNFPHKPPQQREYLMRRPHTDVYVQLEAERSFAELLRRVLEARDGGKGVWEEPIPGCVYLHPETRRSADPRIVYGELLPRIKDLDEIPSPYLDGWLAPFFDGRLTPFLETNRGCPFECSFCHTGSTYFQKANLFSIPRIQEEIAYIAPRASALGIVNLTIADTNFGMYARDREVCEALLRAKEKHRWPMQVLSTTGKNNKERVIDITKIMGDAFSVTMSVQSMDPTVLTHIKRSNIRLDDYIKINQTLREQGRATKAELIVGMPGETRESFVRGLEQVISAGVTSVATYTLMLLYGTEFKDPEYRARFGIQGKYRIVPLDFGEYAGERVFDVEEVGISSKDMRFEDYLWIRGLCLMVEVLHNNRPFDELIRYAVSMGVTRFEMIRRAYEALPGAPAVVQDLVRQFMGETRSELWDSEEALVAHYRKEENYQKLVRGEAGGNLIYKYKAVSLAFCNVEWAQFLGSLCLERAKEAGESAQQLARREEEVGFLVEYAKHKLHGVLNAEADLSPRRLSGPYDLLAWGQSPEGSQLCDFRTVEPVPYRFEYTPEQLQARADTFKRWGTHASGLSKIVTRVSNVGLLFRKVRKEREEGPARPEEQALDQFVRYTLSN